MLQKVFHRLRLKITLTFTLVIFILLIAQSCLFLALNHNRNRNETEAKMARDAQRIILLLGEKELSSDILTAPDQIRSRIYDADGELFFSGHLFLGQKERLRHEPWHLEYADNSYLVLTFPIQRGGILKGYLQIADLEYSFLQEVEKSLAVIIFNSALFSLLAFVLGMWFAHFFMTPSQKLMMRLQQFTQDVSHELKTPLANVSSTLELALKSGKYKEGIVFAMEDIGRLKELINKLLHLVTLSTSSLHKKSVNITVLVEKIVADFQPRFDAKSVQLTAELQRNVIRMADADFVNMACNNLISNALKFTPEGSAVRVILTHRSLEVRDYGMGMSPDVRERIFDRFFKADPSRAEEGFGLGLTMVKRLIDVHGWRITVRSNANEGSSFTIWFDKKR